MRVRIVSRTLNVWQLELAVLMKETGEVTKLSVTVSGGKSCPRVKDLHTDKYKVLDIISSNSVNKKYYMSEEVFFENAKEMVE